ncbi:MAG: hypothetical protein ACJ749_14005 [Flavisolibacter sp.]
MTGKICLWALITVFTTTFASAQDTAKRPVIDTSYSEEDYNLLFNELDALLDSLTAPRSFVLFNLGIGNGFFNYETKSSNLLTSLKKTFYTPSLAYFSKTGVGVSGTVVMVNDGVNLNPYQFYFTGSYDYLKNSKFITGFALTHFFTRDSLPFYTSPLKNEVYAYFVYKKLFVKPSVAVSYGWGTRSDYAEREDQITSLRLGLKGYTRIDTRESINDFNVITSVRHDFYWLNVLGKNDYVRLTPQIVFTSGTQKFGFNQTSSSYAVLPQNRANVLYSSDELFLDDELLFQPLSLSTYIKTEYSKGKFFLQPQVVFDYYFPATEKKLSTAFVMNVGVIF